MSIVEQQLVNQQLAYLEKKRSHAALSVVLIDQMIQTYNHAAEDGTPEKIQRAGEAWSLYEKHESSPVTP